MPQMASSYMEIFLGNKRKHIYFFHKNYEIFGKNIHMKYTVQIFVLNINAKYTFIININHKYSVQIFPKCIEHTVKLNCS